MQYNVVGKCFLELHQAILCGAEFRESCGWNLVGFGWKTSASLQDIYRLSLDMHDRLHTGMDLLEI